MSLLSEVRGSHLHTHTHTGTHAYTHTQHRQIHTHTHARTHTHTHTHSDLPWFKVFYRSLDKISDLRLDHQHELVEPFLAGLRSHPIPSLTMETVLSVVPEGVDTGQVRGVGGCVGVRRGVRVGVGTCGRVMYTYMCVLNIVCLYVWSVMCM